MGTTLSVHRVTARPGSLKRAAIEAAELGDRPAPQRIIDFNQTLPFTQIPSLVADGFASLTVMFRRGDPKILEHYEVARQCLGECLGDPLCDLLLMIVLTMASSSVTPWVPVKEREFMAGPRKEPKLFAANLTTRMLWFLRPDRFPWDQDAGSVLRISEMTKKIGEI
jgi:hypothetical protein